MRKKLAIIGAALFQVPVIIKAKEMGIETHVFAWATGDEGERIADCFYPISIRDKEEILKECLKIDIDGIVSISSDLAMETVNYVAYKLNLSGNSIESTKLSTNKYFMRKAFEANGDPSPKSVLIDVESDPEKIGIDFPLIVKPTDRSGSRGVQKVKNLTQLRNAIHKAREYSFEKKVIVEEFVKGNEYSVEYISQKGKHWFLSVTEKITTGEPYYIEIGHRQPANLAESVIKRIKEIAEHALDTLKIENGASHIEIKIYGDDINIIEIGGRMGGDFIGSDLIPLSTGYDYVKAVIDIALGNKLDKPNIKNRKNVGVNFIITKDDIRVYDDYKSNCRYTILKEHIDSDLTEIVTDSSNRHGYYIFEE